MATNLTTIGGITAYRETRPVCTHEAQTAARLEGDTVASVWECDDCGHQTPFDDSDFAFCNAQRWVEPARRGFFGGVR